MLTSSDISSLQTIESGQRCSKNTTKERERENNGENDRKKGSNAQESNYINTKIDR